MQVPKILIIDDEVAYLEIIVNIIEEIGVPSQILQAFNGKSAFEIAKKESPDLIITDWEMGEISGIELIKLLKKEKSTMNIPVIMCTGIMISSANLATSFNAGAVDFIRKPIDKIELSARISSMLKLSKSYKKIIKQNNQLEQQNNEINKINIELNKQKQKVTDSIKYAQKIQNAILPSNEVMKEILPEHFIFNKPKDIISGDFYWIKKIDKSIIIAVADCTGHGVPGAFMSLLGITFLNEIFNKKEILKPNHILEELRKQVKRSLHQSTENKPDKSEYLSGINDGIDIALCVIDTELMTLDYSGANNPVYLIQNNQITELQPTENPIGIHFDEVAFKNKKIQLSKNESVYLFSDGFTDQFGGKNNLKFSQKRFKELILEISKKTILEQKDALESTFTEWKSDCKQIDDILVIGFKI